MIKKIVWGIIIVAMLGVIVIYLVKPGSVFSSKNVFQNPSDTSDKESEKQKSDESHSGTEQDAEKQPEVLLEADRIPDENTFDIADVVTNQGLQYKVNSYRVTKERGDFIIEPYMKWTDKAQADENGNLTGVYSYVIVDITVQNASDAADDVCLMNLGLQIRDQEGKTKYEVEGLLSEVRTFSGLDSSRGKTAATFPLKPGEIYEGEVAYIETDEMLNNSKLELIIDPHGTPGNSIHTMCIRLN